MDTVFRNPGRRRRHAIGLAMQRMLARWSLGRQHVIQYNEDDMSVDWERKAL